MLRGGGGVKARVVDLAPSIGPGKRRIGGQPELNYWEYSDESRLRTDSN